MTIKNGFLTHRSDLPLLIGQALGGVGLLLLVAVQLRIFATVFDQDFALLAVGAALFGMATGLALGHWLIPEETRAVSRRRASAGLMLAGLTASGGIAWLLSWPLGGVVPLLLMVIVFAVPFAGWGYGVAFISRSPDAQAIRGAWLIGASTGLMLSGSLVDYAGSPLLVGWWAAILLGVGALVTVGRGMTAGVGAGTVMTLASAAYFLVGGFSLEPSWSAAGLAAARPLYPELRSDKLAAAPATLWSGSHRTDLLTYQEDPRWLFTDATAPVAVVTGGADRGIDWLKERFPLLAIPLLAGRPERLLTVGPFPGPELDLARALGVREVRGLAYNADAVRLLHPAGRAGFASGDVATRYNRDPRGSLRKGREGFDQIVLPVTHINRRGWVGANLEDRHLYSVEAFHDYWQRLRPGGLLVLTTADEVLFAKSILSVWGMLERHPAAAGGSPPALRSWGLRLTSGASLQGPYHYLLLVAKGNVATELPARLKQVIQGLPVEALFGPGLGAGRHPVSDLFGRSQQSAPSSPVEALFGPGFLATGHYAGLYQLGGLAKAEEILTRALSQQAGHWIRVTPATDRRPTFFDVVPGPRPELKWLFTGTLAALIGGVLFALPSVRRGDVVQRRPGIAVFLVYFALLGAAGVMLIVGLLGQTARLVGLSQETQAHLLVSLLPGAAIALSFPGQPFVRPRRIAPPLYAMGMAALLYWTTGPAYAAIAGWPLPARWLIAAGCGVLLGAALAHLCDMALRRLTALAPPIVPWAWLMLGTAALGGVVLAEWWAATWGWDRVWAALSGAYLVAFAAGFWLWRRPDVEPAPAAFRGSATAA